MADDKHPQLKSLRESIHEQVKGLAPSRKEQVQQMWTEELLDKQCSAIVPGIALLEKLEKGLFRHKPMEQLDADGKVIGTFWTKVQIEDKKKATEDVEKLRKLLEEAITNGDIQDLNQFVKSRSDSGKGKEGSSGKPTADTD